MLKKDVVIVYPSPIITVGSLEKSRTYPKPQNSSNKQ